jgi:hypothetical protein
MRPLLSRSESHLLVSLGLLMFLGAAGVTTACSRPAGPVQRYQVRAELLQLPEGPNGDLLIRHEAIDGFADRDGKKIGMDPMSMPFPVAAGLSLAGFAPGDVVRCTLEVDWQERSPVKIAAVEKLPAGTKLTFRQARP